MDTEFANLFVQKQKDMITELTMKVLFAETKLALAEKIVQELEAARAQISELNDKLKAASATIDTMTQESVNRRKEIEKLTAEKQASDQQLATLKAVARTKFGD